jgi:hypothetical protein
VSNIEHSDMPLRAMMLHYDEGTNAWNTKTAPYLLVIFVH